MANENGTETVTVVVPAQGAENPPAEAAVAEQAAAIVEQAAEIAAVIDEARTESAASAVSLDFLAAEIAALRSDVASLAIILGDRFNALTASVEALAEVEEEQAEVIEEIVEEIPASEPAPVAASQEPAPETPAPESRKKRDRKWL